MISVDYVIFISC